MSNMGYCRFRNTYADLIECLEAIEHCDTLSDDEYQSAYAMFHSLVKFMYDYGIVVESDNEMIDEMLDPLRS